jgi:hypothetical protein
MMMIKRSKSFVCDEELWNFVGDSWRFCSTR